MAAFTRGALGQHHNRIDRVSDGGTPGLKVLCELIREFHPVLSPLCVADHKWSTPLHLLAFRTSHSVKKPTKPSLAGLYWYTSKAKAAPQFYHARNLCGSLIEYDGCCHCQQPPETKDLNLLPMPKTAQRESRELGVSCIPWDVYKYSKSPYI